MRKSYSVLTTDGFVVHTRGVGEADRVVTVLTERDGLMDVYARSVRKEGAKMRGATKPYARVSLSVVLGKRNILKDIVITDTLDLLWCDREKYTALVVLLHFLRTLIPVTESCDEGVFHTIETAARLLQESDPAHAQDILLIAQVIVLALLGYVSDHSITPSRFENIFAETVASPHRQKELRQHLQNALYHQ